MDSGCIRRRRIKEEENGDGRGCKGGGEEGGEGEGVMLRT